jgi:erythrocyte membrane protein band 4.1
MLYTRVCDFIHLEEKDYFGLTFINNEKTKCWLDNDKRVRSQLKGKDEGEFNKRISEIISGVDPIFRFHVKFYPPEPALLQEDLTR